MDNPIYLCKKSVHMSRPLEKYDPDKLVNNPFVTDLKIPVTRTIAPNQYTFVVDMDDSEKVGTYTKTGFYIDKVQSSRVYYTANAKEKIYKLSDKAQRLYLYLLYNLPKSKPYVQINKQNYMVKNEVKSRITYSNAIKELIAEGFITGTQYKTVYWINPTLFTSGNRLKIYPNNLDVKGEL